MMSMNRSGISSWLEPLLAFLVCAGLIRIAIIFYYSGYLAQPFFYEPSDTWMDWFNTAYWARDPGAYDSWLTIYPPLSFVFLRVVGISSCYGGAEGIDSRSCDWIGVVMLHAIYLTNILLTARAFWRIDRGTAVPRTIAIGLGMPMLFALERGNLILLCYTCVLLAYGPLVRSAKVRWLCAGLAGNFKLYLVAPIFAQLLRRRWRWFEGAAFATVAIYLITFGLQGDGTPSQILRNLQTFTENAQGSRVLDIWYASTYNRLIDLIRIDSFPIYMIADSSVTEIAIIGLSLFKLTGQVSIIVAAAAAWMRPEVVPRTRLVFFAIALAVISTEAGGYTMVLMILFVFMERWKNVGPKIALVISYILCIPGDVIVGGVPPVVADSFLAGRPVTMYFGVGLGPFVWPGMLLIMCIAMSATTIRAVWEDLRDDGWQGRWRYRRDAAILPWARHPKSPICERELEQRSARSS